MSLSSWSQGHEFESYLSVVSLNSWSQDHEFESCLSIVSLNKALYFDLILLTQSQVYEWPYAGNRVFGRNSDKAVHKVDQSVQKLTLKHKTILLHLVVVTGFKKGLLLLLSSLNWFKFIELSNNYL